MECFICLNEIDQSYNSFYLKCCKNYTHMNCIETWINHDTNSNNKNCPYCRKINSDISNLVCNNTNDISNIELSNLSNNDIDIIIIDNNYSNNNNQTKNYLCSFIFITIAVLIFILFFHV